MTKEENIELFTKYVHHYFYSVFKMKEFEMYVQKDKEDISRANMTFDNEGQSICISYEETWVQNTKLTNKEIQEIAFHEVMEGLLGEMQELIDSRYITENMVAPAVHRVIQRLVNILLPYLPDLDKDTKIKKIKK